MTKLKVTIENEDGDPIAEVVVLSEKDEIPAMDDILDTISTKFETED